MKSFTLFELFVGLLFKKQFSTFQGIFYVIIITNIKIPLLGVKFLRIVECSVDEKIIFMIQ